MVDGVRFAEVDREMAEGVKDGHIQLVVLFRSQAACSELRYECGA